MSSSICPKEAGGRTVRSDPRMGSAMALSELQYSACQDATGEGTDDTILLMRTPWQGDGADAL